MGDPLGESRISFRSLSLLTTYAITYKLVTSSPQFTASPLAHHQCGSIPSNLSSAAPHPISVWRVKRHKTNDAAASSLATNERGPCHPGFPTCSTKQIMQHCCYGSPQHAGISRPVGCRRVQCPCGGGVYITMSMSTLSYIHE